MNNSVIQILNHYKQIEKKKDYQWVKWTKNRKRFRESDANAFFIGVMLDQGQAAERAWEGAEHLVDNHFQNNTNLWEAISKTHHLTIKKICQTGFEGTSYASVFTFNKFPKWLRNASFKMLNEYGGDSRNIWNVSSAVFVKQVVA